MKRLRTVSEEDRQPTFFAMQMERFRREPLGIKLVLGTGAIAAISLVLTVAILTGGVVASIIGVPRLAIGVVLCLSLVYAFWWLDA